MRCPVGLRGTALEWLTTPGIPTPATGAQKKGAGLIFREAEPYESYEAASQYIEDQSDKWGPLIAVRYQDLVEELPEKRKAKHAELERQWLELNRERQAYPRQVFERVTQGATVLKTCSGCGSRLAVARMAYAKHSVNCPICDGNLMLTASDVKKIAAMDVKLTKLRQAMKDLYVHKDNGTQWLVGGWCPS